MEGRGGWGGWREGGGRGGKGGKGGKEGGRGKILAPPKLKFWIRHWIQVQKQNYLFVCLFIDKLSNVISSGGSSHKFLGGHGPSQND